MRKVRKTFLARVVQIHEFPQTFFKQFLVAIFKLIFLTHKSQKIKHLFTKLSSRKLVLQNFIYAMTDILPRNNSFDLHKLTYLVLPLSQILST